MLRSRVSSGIDFARLSQAMMRPGIDPRVWVSYAVLKGEPYVDMVDGDQGIFVDLLLLPTQMEATARVGAAYAGNGFGLYMPLHDQDEVLVVAPSGDPNEGLVVTQRLWSPSDPPPQAVADNPTDVTLVVEPGKNLRMNVQGGGNVYLAAQGGGNTYITADTGKVFLGSADGTRGVARLEDTSQGGTLQITGATVPAPTPTTTLILTYTPPGGVPQVATISLAPVSLATGAIDFTFNLAGKIDSASAVVESV